MDPQQQQQQEAEATVPLTRSDDGVSLSSQRSGRSLLERIQAQRDREQQQTATAPGNSTPQQIQVPQYNPVPQQANNSLFDNPQQQQQQQQQNSTNNASAFFSNAWSNISESMEQGMASMSATTGPDTNIGAHDALLAPSGNAAAGPGEYSMSGYFLTFINDMYGLFQSLPVILRWIVCLVLLYIAIRLL